MSYAPPKFCAVCRKRLPVRHMGRPRKICPTDACRRAYLADRGPFGGVTFTAQHPVHGEARAKSLGGLLAEVRRWGVRP